MNRKWRWLVSGIMAFVLLLQTVIIPMEVAQAVSAPTVGTVGYTNFAGYSADLQGTVTATNYPLTGRGFYYATQPNPTANDQVLVGLPPFVDGAFTGSLVDLNASTTYYFRAYASDVNATNYGVAQSFTTSPAAVPTVAYLSYSNITSSGADLSANVTSRNGANVTVRGFAYSTTNPSPTTSDSTATSGNGTGVYTSTLTGLLPNTTYYIRAYAVNSAGTSYSDADQFTTGHAAPTVGTVSYSNVTGYSADLQGDVTADNGDAVTERGFYYATHANPMASDTVVAGSPATGTGAFTGTLDNLNANTTYYFRAYATNVNGTNYGNAQSFTTGAAAVPAVAYLSYSNITSSGVDLSANVTRRNGADVTVRGFAYSTTNPSPTTSDSTATSGNGTGVYTSTLTGLLPNTTYYIRAYAVNSAGTSYSDADQFTTGHAAPTVGTVSYSNVTGYSADLQGDVTADNGDAVTERGFYYATHANTTASDSVLAGNPSTGAGAFTGSLTNLDANTTYYFRAYAVNVNGTNYGSEQSFTTGAAVAPTVNNLIYTNITKTGASLTGEVVSRNGANVTDRGFVYSAVNAVPTTADTKVSTGNGLGPISTELSGLQPNTTYYVRAYAVNAGATGYSDVGSFTTLALSATGTLVNAGMANVELSPAFDENIGTYTMFVENNVSQTNLTVTFGQGAVAASLTVLDLNNNPIGNPESLSDTQTSSTYTLQDGTNKFKVEVQAENATIASTYMFVVYRSPAAPVINNVPSPGLDVNVHNSANGTPTEKTNITDLIGPELPMLGTLYTADGQPVNIPPFKVNPDGTFKLPTLSPGEYRLALSVTAPTGEQLAGQVATLVVDSNGHAKLDAELIDPYGTITDAVTGKTIDGVHMTLHWADTAANKAKGRVPGELVILPELPDFPPNKNHDPQTSVNGGLYGWMVFPDSDYYILGEKEGYETFDSRKDTRDEKHGPDSYVRNGNIHVAQSIVEYSFKMQPKLAGTGEQKAYINGYEGGLFKPQGSLTRAELAVILTRILTAGPAKTVAPAYSDLDADHWAAAAIQTASEQGWLTGYPSGEFAPDRAVTRAELAQVLLNIKHWSIGKSSSFTDLEDHWALPAISAAEEQGLLTGYPDRTFKPDQAVTRAEAVTIFNKLLGWYIPESTSGSIWSDVSTSFWAYGDISAASATRTYKKYETGTVVFDK